jgi:hypothetical protein
MSKTVATALLTKMQSGVTKLATLVTIKRQDGRVFRLTNNDTPIVFQGFTYDNTIPFNLSASTHSSELSVDNVDLALHLDGTVFVYSDFKANLYQHAEVTIALVDRTNPDDGQMVINRGWLGPMMLNTLNTVSITVVGLLKILDFEIGRVYQPTCDADLGDSRCKVALDWSKAYAPENIYANGEWFYVYDEAEMTPISLTNGSFETDGSVPANSAITGWTKSPGARFTVAGSTTPAAANGTYTLSGTTVSATRFEQYVQQDIDLVAAGISAPDIDDGFIMFHLSAAFAHITNQTTFPRLLVEILNADGVVIDYRDTRYITLDTADVFRRRAHVFPLVEGARTARIYVSMYKTSGSSVQCFADDVKAFWWDTRTDDPTHQLIHKVIRVGQYEGFEAYYPENSSFERDGNLALSATNNITGWTKVSGTWGVSDSLGGVSPDEGNRFLISGSAGVIEAEVHLIDDVKLTATKIDAEAYSGKFQCHVFWGNTSSAATIALRFTEEDGTPVSTVTISSAVTVPSAPADSYLSGGFSIPADARKVFVQFTSSGAATPSLAFDDAYLNILDTTKPETTDPTTGSGEDGYVWDVSGAGVKNVNGGLITKSRAAKVLHDEVASVTSSKVFVATNMAGVAGTFETALIRWITGANAGQLNVIRAWNSGTKAVGLYFTPVNAIQAGDRFEYHYSCQKRFLEDCVNGFDNGINFRGFPYLPSTTGV